jgi:hypothetical protein
LRKEWQQNPIDKKNQDERRSSMLIFATKCLYYCLQSTSHGVGAYLYRHQAQNMAGSGVGVGVRGAGVRIIKSNATTEARNGFE